MAESETETKQKQAFTARVRQARVQLGWKQWEMAHALGMAQDKYKQYEGRSIMPVFLLDRFCLVARVDMVWLVTGRGKPMPAPQPEPIAAPAPKTVRKARTTRAA